MATIETSRLQLRVPEEADVTPFMEIHEDPAVVAKVSVVGPTGDRARAWRFVAVLVGHWQLRGFGQWAVVDKATGGVIGRVGPWQPEGCPEIELGWIIRRSHWNRGFATEAVTAGLRWLWDHVDTDHVISKIEPDNAVSLRVAKKIGARYEGEGLMLDRPVHIYGLHRSEAR